MKKLVAGIPIKERGIRWEEKYGDKSAYLKKSYEEQVGSGSYFRWEGHDHTTGADYYAVVTPGFSKKHGYHFFAALRKMPAENGASGKKFKNQAEALSYAYDTWRIPPPDTKPHKPYIDKDLIGKPIVLENVHASINPICIKTAEKIIIDVSCIALEKEAMAVKNMQGNAIVIPDHYGMHDYAAKARHSAVVNTIAQPGVGNYSSKQWLMIDRKDQAAGTYMAPHGKTTKAYSGMATCQPPSQEHWDVAMNESGMPAQNRLFAIDKKKNSVNFRPALMQQHPEYQIKTFSDVLMIHPVAYVGLAKKIAFDQFANSFIATRSKLQPDAQVKIINVEEPAKSKGEFKDPTRGNYAVSLQMPIDLYKTFLQAVNEKSLAWIENLSWQDNNAMELYSWFDSNKQLETPEQIAAAKAKPVLEHAYLTKGQLVVYDDSLYPIGIKVKRNPRFDKEAGELEDEYFKQDVKFEFAPGVVDRWLAMPEVNGNFQKLRSLLSNNKIDIRREDCVDARTCATKNRHVYGQYPVLENGVPKLDEHGNLQSNYRKMFESYQNSIDDYFVRVFDTNAGKEVIMSLDDVAKNMGTTLDNDQMVHGIPLTAERAFYYLPFGAQPGQPESFHPVEAGETKIYDPNSKGKLKNGSAYLLVAEAERATPKKSGIERFEQKEQDIDGFYGGTSKRDAGVNFRDNLITDKISKQRRVGTVADIWHQHRNGLHAIVLPNGTRLELPSDPDAPENANHPAVKYLSNPNNVVVRYGYVGPRMYEEVPLLEGAPAAKKPLQISWMTTEEGGWTTATDPMTGQEKTLTITDKDLSVGVQGKRKKVFFRQFGTMMNYIAAKFGLKSEEIGPYVNISDEDMHAAYDKVKEIRKKVQSGTPLDQLPYNERVFAEFAESGNEIPKIALQMLSKISNHPKDFEPRKGTVYQLKKIGSQEPLETHPHLFTTEDKANEFKKWMETPTQMGGGGHLAGSLFIVEHQNAEMTLSAFRQRAAGKKPSLVENIPLREEEQELEPAGKVEPSKIPSAGRPESVPEPIETPIAHPGFPWLKEPIKQEPIPQGSAEPIQAPAIKAPDSSPAQPEQPKRMFPLFPAEQPKRMSPLFPTETQPEPKRMFPLFPAETQPEPKRMFPLLNPDVTQSKEIEKLIKLANLLDGQGKIKEADAIDQLIKAELVKIKQ